MAVSVVENPEVSPFAGEAISVVSLHEQVGARVRQLIVTARLSPGQKINEKELSDLLGVSRTPLREALKVLAWQGFVRLAPNRGFSVSTPTPKAIKERLQIIIALEVYAANWLCADLSDDKLVVLEQLHTKLLDAVKSDDVDRFVTVNADFHHAIILSLDNHSINETYQLQLAHLHWARHLTGKVREHYKEAAVEHELIMQAIRSRDSAQIRIELERHHGQLMFE